MNHLSVRLCILVSFLSSVSSLAAGDGAGARGGGTGISCPNYSAPITLEEFTNIEAGRPIAVPDDRRKVVDWARPLMQDDGDDFFQVWKAIWEQIGSYDNWPQFDKEKFLKNLFSENEFVQSFRRFGLGFDFSAGPIQNDDGTVIPKECSRVALSFFDSSQVVLRSPQAKPLSERTKRALELHESLYQLGILRFGHTLPLRARAVVQALLAQDRNAFKSAISVFKAQSRSLEAIRALSNVFVLESTSTRTWSRTDQTTVVRCPIIVSMAFDDSDRVLISSIFDTSPSAIETRLISVKLNPVFTGNGGDFSSEFEVQPSGGLFPADRFSVDHYFHPRSSRDISLVQTSGLILESHTDTHTVSCVYSDVDTHNGHPGSGNSKYMSKSLLMLFNALKPIDADRL